ncbi:MAG TPA: hypothetical protein VJA86_02760 [Candidatus Nanoarchaeia archaeon]|nr:hypothetical protein [Candidatus Nanoarchaeia archaeon]
MEEREERECFRCERTGDSVRLFDAISDNKPVVICGMCAQIENIPIIKRPSTEQLKSAERPYTVRQRLSKMAHINVDGGQGHEKPKTLDEFNKERLRVIRESMPVSPLNLTENFHWYIQKMRRAKNLTRKQLADSLAESEAAIKLVEQGILPSGAEDLLKKLEQFFKIKLTKSDDGYVDESISPLLKQDNYSLRKSLQPAQSGPETQKLQPSPWLVKRMQEKRAARQAVAAEAGQGRQENLVIDRATIPSLRIGSLRKIKPAEAEPLSASNIMQDIITEEENTPEAERESIFGMDDYDWKDKTAGERRKILEQRRRDERKREEKEKELKIQPELDDSLMGSDLEFEEK